MRNPPGAHSRRVRRPEGAAQRGAALILALIGLVLGSLYLLISSANTATAQIELRRTETNAVVMKQARDALIVWAAKRGYQPGALPCPDTNGDGFSDTDIDTDAVIDVPAPATEYVAHNNANAGGYCTTAVRRIGRLPWRTLGLPDLRDASGEQLWYVLSNNFRASGGFQINSDTAGRITLVGAAPATNVIAIIFAPGAAIGGQDRSPANLNQVAQYLEGENANAPALAYEDVPGTTDIYEIRPRCDRTDCPAGPFNDQLLLVTAADYFPVLEAVVQRRIEDTVKPKLTGFFNTWRTATITTANPAGTGFYPFAAPFEDQSIGTPGSASDLRRPQSAFIGRTAPLPVDRQTNGLLPVTTDVDLVVWTGGIIEKDPAAVRLGDVIFEGCALNPAPLLPPPPATQISCGFRVTDEADIRVRATVSNIARTFALPVEGGNVNLQGGVILTQVIDGHTQSVDPASGTLTVTHRAWVAAGECQAVGACKVVIDLPAQVFEGLALSSDPSTGWFIRNGWFRQTYYAVSPARLAGGTAPCEMNDPLPALPPDPARACLRVDNLAVVDANRKEVVLVLAGMNLPGRPPRVPLPAVSTVIANYFESENGSSPNYLEVPDYVFRRDPVRGLTFNDRLVVVAP